MSSLRLSPTPSFRTPYRSLPTIYSDINPVSASKHDSPVSSIAGKPRELPRICTDNRPSNTLYPTFQENASGRFSDSQGTAPTLTSYGTRLENNEYQSTPSISSPLSSSTVSTPDHASFPQHRDRRSSSPHSSDALLADGGGSKIKKSYTMACMFCRQVRCRYMPI